ncbi:fungistatic metabolite [Ceratobasidium theobromae]|uniref:Fungistatic metabolite n=1 Tax=Ceratobasidium theobromae TaxID=1582974 RepID=A0A5N5QKM4_9AGAM|nr:fungistatic metabolite [Ceratobasidium theobromae]
MLLQAVLLATFALSQARDHVQRSHSHARLSRKLASRSLQHRATPVLPQGWAYKYCAREADGRTLTGYSFTSNSMTVDLCVSTCVSHGFSIAGVEFGSECYCGNSFVGQSSGGGTVAPESECNMPCAGDSSQICGAGWRLSAYGSTTTTPGAPVLPAGWSATSKCITEPSTGRALVGNSFISQGMTLDMCIDVCDQTGFSYAGAEYANECYCSNTISTANGGGVEVSASECNMSCAGNAQQKCGAGYRLTLYTKTAAANNPLPSGWVENFCTVDQSSRVLSEFSVTSSSMTPAYSGVENGNECWCGNTVNQAFATKVGDCKTPCAGDSTQYCGAGWRLMVYIKVPTLTTRTSLWLTFVQIPDVPATGAWTLTAGGTSGVVMTHAAVTSSDTVLIIDRKEGNPLLKSNGKPAIGAVWNLQNNSPRALDFVTHSFCSSGNFLSNGTMVNFGGMPTIDRDGEMVPDGMQGVRFFNPCAANGDCQIYENPPRIRLSSLRWYPTSVRLHDGSAIIVGGMITSSFTNSPQVNNPSYEFFPPKNINGYNGTKIPSQFFLDTLPHNTYPHLFALPSKKIFVAANNQAMLLDWQNNVETRLPNFPNGQRVAYPMSAAGVLLPLTPANGYTPEVLFCGGSQISDQIDGTLIDAHHDYASTQCARMVLNDAGIAAGWKVEHMPEPRVMSDGVLLPNGKILIVNGARTGTAGYGILKYRIGDSNADNPNYVPLLYDPAKPVGQRFSQDNMPMSNIARLYHSVATLLPSGAIMLGGSNPNDNTETRPWPTEYRVEYLSPSYMFGSRPTFSGLPAKVDYKKSFALTVNIPSGTAKVKVVLMDLGFITHGVHMDQKLVELVSTLSNSRTTLTVTGPPDAPTFSPGPGWIFVVMDDIPSVGQKIMIGKGDAPPKDDGAIANLLATTPGP